MKKNTITNIMLGVLCVAALGGLSSTIIKNVNSSSPIVPSTSNSQLTSNKPSTSKDTSISTDNKIDPYVEFYESETLYGDDFKKIIKNIPSDVDYTITYDCEEANLLNQKEPTPNGKQWTAIVTIEENDKYHGGVYRKTFDYIGTAWLTLSNFFDFSNDSWGGDSNGTSVNCSSSNILQSPSMSLTGYYELTIDTTSDTSACLDSKYEMFDGSFRIKFKTDLSDYGTFAFWLTGVESGSNTKDEVTFELLPDNKAVFGSAKGDDYKSINKTLDKNYADGYWHELILNYNHETPEASVEIDGETIYTFESENLPNVPYVKPHLGLLYPINPKWTGEKTEKINKLYLASYKAYKVNGDEQK